MLDLRLYYWRYEMPPKCKTCLHPERDAINSQIKASASLRDIALQFGMSHAAVHRHIETCLGLTIGVLIQERKIEQAIDVYEEFREQLAFAKQLRTAAQEYLGDANDPLKLAITPKAHEIEVTYFDHNDMEERGEIMFPKKKTAQLNVILEAVYSDAQLEPDKYKITTVDIRKFALDAINTTDTCIDKFAKIGGAYTQDKKNETDKSEIARAVVAELIAQGFDKDTVVKKAASRYGVLESELVG